MQPRTRSSGHGTLRTSAARNVPGKEEPDGYVDGLYRPFSKQRGYFNPLLNHERGQLPSMFPTPQHDNIGFVLTGAASHYEFGLIATNLLPNLHTLDTGQFFPRWT